MPALRDLQSALGRALLASRSQPAPQQPEFDEVAVGIYRNTCLSTLTSALGLSFPAVRRLVGAGFFENAAQEFIRTHPPASAYLNDYGREFPAFLAQFPHATSLAYLADVARLEWAVNCALHAADAPPLQLAALAELDAALVPRLSFVPHPAITVLRLAAPADALWRAVLDEDQAAIAAWDATAGAVWLLIERSVQGVQGVQVRRMAPAAWRFTQRLCAGEPLQAVLDEPGSEMHSGEQLSALLADHLASGRFTSWRTP
jgi:hypothetical protein